MKIVRQAYEELFPGKICSHAFTLNYSGKFKGYNANVRYTSDKMHFKLSKNWQGVSEDIVIGLLQSLMAKVFSKRKAGKTMNMELYNIFLKKAHIGIIPTKAEPELLESFERINNQFFFGRIELPNLVWGRESVRKLGSYDYGSDTISISQILREKGKLLDYVMYHEMLHKKHKFTHNGMRSIHHTRQFKDDEKKFPDAELIEKQLAGLGARKKLWSSLWR